MVSHTDNNSTCPWRRRWTRATISCAIVSDADSRDISSGNAWYYNIQHKTFYRKFQDTKQKRSASAFNDAIVLFHIQPYWRLISRVLETWKECLWDTSSRATVDETSRTWRGSRDAPWQWSSLTAARCIGSLPSPGCRYISINLQSIIHVKQRKLSSIIWQPSPFRYIPKCICWTVQEHKIGY